MKPKLKKLQKKLQRFQRRHLTPFKASGWIILIVVGVLVIGALTGAPDWVYDTLPPFLYVFWYLQGRDDAERAEAKRLRTLREYRLGIETANASWEAVKGAYKALGGKNINAVQSIYDEYRFEMSKGPRNTIKAYNRTITKKRERLNERKASQPDTQGS